MTISDIAKMAGVSSAAVSRYLNGGPLSEQKRAIIREVVEKTGYRPDTDRSDSAHRQSESDRRDRPQHRLPVGRAAHRRHRQ